MDSPEAYQAKEYLLIVMIRIIALPVGAVGLMRLIAGYPHPYGSLRTVLLNR